MAGATPLGNMVIKLGLDDADFGRGVANSKKQVSYLAKEMSANMKIADMAGDKLGKLSTRYDSLTQVMKAQQNQVSALKKAYDESFVDGKATDSTKRLATQLQDANGKLASYQSQLQNTAGQLARYKVETEGITGSLNKFGDGAIAAGKRITAVSDGVGAVGGALTKSVTLPLVAVGAAAVKAAIDYESAFAGVKKTVDEQVDSNGRVIISYDDLSNGIRAMSKELPASASEIAEVAEQAGQLGIKTQDVLSFSRTMIDLGESTNMSATDAATAIAKIANITGMTADQYQRFGSSVTALGNNFATTESDIIMMANRLASAGTLAGLTNQEILGLSTAMSSVGIEAEAGGTAMTQTLAAIEKAAVQGASAVGDLEQRANAVGLSYNDIAVAALKGGNALKKTAAQMGMSNKELRRMYDDAGKASESLSQFAEISGMSSEQFALTWKNKPIEAIQSFIKGLGQLSDKGESATLVLDDMGLKGVRQGNMLKSLALASDTLTGAVDMSSKAWDENSALTAEANKRYETTESKLKMLKNEVTDVAIEFGGPLVDALRDGVEASKPVLQFLGDMAKKFSSLDSEQQQNIIKWALIAAAAGPTLSIFGKIGSVVGTTTTGIGNLSKNLVKLAGNIAEKGAKGTVKSMASEFLGLSTAATSASGAMAGGSAATAGLATGLSSILIPAGIAAGAIAVVGVATYAGIKAYEAHQLAGAKWGTEVTKEQDRVITKSLDLRDNAVSSVNAYSDGVKTAAKDVVDANQKIVDSIQETIDKENKRNSDAANGLYSQEAKQRAEEYNKAKAAENAKTVSDAKTTMDNINKIMVTASNENRKLSNEERKAISQNYKSLSDDQLKAAGFNKGQRIAIESAYQSDLSKMSEKQLQDRSANVMKALDKDREQYNSQKSKLAEIYGEGTKNYKEELSKLDQGTKQNNQSMILGLAKLTLAQGFSLENMSGAWEKYGYTTKEVSDLVNSSSSESTKDAENLSKIINLMGKSWEDVKLDPKTGKLSVEGREELVDTLVSTGQWQQLSLEEKKLLVNGDESRLAFLDSLDKADQWQKYYLLTKDIPVENRDAIQKIMEAKNGMEQWKAFSVEDKKLLADNAPLLASVLGSEEKLKAWNALPAETKQILADSGNFFNILSGSQERMNSWKALPDPVKRILGDNSNYIQNDSQATDALNAWKAMSDPIKKMLGDNTNVLSAIYSSEENLNIWKRMPEEAKKLLGDNANFLASKEGATTELNNWARNNPPAKNLSANDNTAPGKTSAQNTINSLNGKTVLLFANNSANEGKNSAQSTVDLFTGKSVSLVSVNNTGTGVALAQQTLSLIPSEKSVYLNFINSGKPNFANGTNFHTGGHAVVNDQKGPLYKEIVQLPTGESFIPDGRDVLLDLPRGSKVIKASKTKSLMHKAGIPKYAEGVGIPENSKVIRNLRSIPQPSKELSAPAKVVNEIKREIIQKIVIENVTWNGEEDIIKLLQRLANQDTINQRGEFG